MKFTIANMEESGNEKPEVLESCKVAPTAAAPSTTTLVLPLTFFDIFCAGPLSIKRIFLYEFPHSTTHFIETTLPALKNSLSKTLQHFFPLSGNLICPPSPHKPFIRFDPNVDSVPLTIQHYTHSSLFKHLVAHHPRYLRELDNHVPELLFLLPNDDDNETFVFPLLSLKITIFPGEGLCIGATYRHVLDGKSFSHFITSWASMCLNNSDDTCLQNSLPFFNREVVRDPKGLESVFLEHYFERMSSWKVTLRGPSHHGGEDEQQIVRITLAFDAGDLERHKKWFSLKCKPPLTNLSRFMVTCAILWVSYVRSIRGASLEENEEEQEWFLFTADCRNRIENIPSTYFGNCVVPVAAVLKRKDFVGEESVVDAVKVIDEAISTMKSDPFRDGEKWMSDVFKMVMTGRAVFVVGSPNLGVYETDFGFGRPSKVEMVVGLNNFAFAESGKERGGFEVGLSLKKDQVDCFLSVFQQLKTQNSSLD